MFFLFFFQLGGGILFKENGVRMHACAFLWECMCASMHGHVGAGVCAENALS